MRKINGGSKKTEDIWRSWEIKIRTWETSGTHTMNSKRSPWDEDP